MIAAVWFLLAIIWPGDCPASGPPCTLPLAPGSTVRAWITDELGVVAERTVYARPDVGSGRPIAKPIGTRDSVYVFASEDGKPRVLQLETVDASGNRSERTHGILFAVGDASYLQDTVWVLGRFGVARRPRLRPDGRRDVWCHVPLPLTGQIRMRKYDRWVVEEQRWPAIVNLYGCYQSAQGKRVAP